MDENILYAEYERIYCGIRKNFSSSVFFPGMKLQNEANAKIIFRYAFEHFLNWTPMDIKQNINWEILQKMKLDTLVKYLDFPGELLPKQDLYYIAHILYPAVVRYNSSDVVISTYKRVLDRQIYRFPRNFFDDEKGKERAILCFRYMINHFLSAKDMKELYYYFAGPEGKKTISTYQLAIPCSLFYAHPLDFLHDAADTQKDEFLYHYLRFKITLQESEAEGNA